jgi:hypothetical protein
VTRNAVRAHRRDQIAVTVARIGHVAKEACELQFVGTYAPKSKRPWIRQERFARHPVLIEQRSTKVAGFQIHFDWAVSPRLFLPAGLALMALLATLRFPANKSWRVAAHTAGVLGLLIGIQFAFAFVPHGVVYSPLSRPLVSAEQSR